MPDRDMETVLDLTRKEHEFLYRVAQDLRYNEDFLGTSLRDRMSVMAGAAIEYYRATVQVLDPNARSD